jgi:hypothetical protein
MIVAHAKTANATVATVNATAFKVCGLGIFLFQEKLKVLSPK